MSYAQLGARVRALAGALHDQFQLRPGDRVAIAAKNCSEYLELLYACWQAGLVAVPTNAKLHSSEFAYILEHSGARVAFTSTELTETIAVCGVASLERVVEVDSPTYRSLFAAVEVDIVSRAPGDPAWLFYTSGTTGRPKGATLTHRNLTAMMFAYFADVDTGAPWRALLHAAPFSHGSGLYALPNVAQAACHVIAESGGFDAAEVYQLIAHWQGLSFFAAPTMVKRLLDVADDFDTTNLKRIIYGGGPMYVADSQAALSRFGPKLTQLYGQGESPMTITALNAEVHADNQHPHWLQRLASVGVAQSCVEVRTIDEAGNHLPAGEIGEIVVRGDSVMLGYWDNPDATAETLRDGWLHTGDVGSFDADGFLTLKDRSKDMIISGGTNIYPREVEEVLLQHTAVAEVSVIGRPDREWGEVVVAYVVMTEAAAASAQLSAQLDALCLQHVARFKRPKDYVYVAELPKNNYGKVLKTALRERDEQR